jgi:hypothetical protein
MPRDYWFTFNVLPSSAASLAPTFISFINSSGQTIAPPTITETYAGSGFYKASYHATQTIAFLLDGATTGLPSINRYITGVFDPQDMFGNSLISIGTSLTALGNTLIFWGASNNALGSTILAWVINTGTSLTAQGVSITAQGVSLTAQGNTLIFWGASNNALGSTILSWVMNTGTSLSSQGTSIIAMGNTLSVLASYVGSTASSFGDSGTDPATVFGYAKRVVEFLEGNQVYTKSSGGLVFSSRGSSYTIASKTVSDTSSTTSKT